MKPELKRAYDAGKLILFAGAGVSRNLGLPEWHELIAHLANELGYDPQIFNAYGTHLSLAEYYKQKKARWGRCAAGWIANGTGPISTCAPQRSTP